MNLRLIAAEVIDDVTDGRALDHALTHHLKLIHEAKDRAFIQAVCYGVCRLYYKLDVMISQFLERPMKAKDSDVHALMMVGLYQLLEMRVPAHAAVSETVNAAKDMKKLWARGLVNAVLRAYLRHPTLDFSNDEEAQFAHPAWWIAKLKKAWPDQYEAILIANNEHPPFSLRAKNREASLKALQEAGLNATAIIETKQGIIVNPPVPVDQLPGFAEGALSVQDAAAQLAVEFLPLKSGARVLDACAAPGGKLTHILERALGLKAVIAVESDEKRIASIHENLNRLHFHANVLCADIKNINAWWDQTPFDCILLDVPCSASGVVRRHPDIKLLRQASDIQKLAIEQLRILEAAWTTLSEGGVLVYVTCSVFPEENDGIIHQFLQKQSNVICNEIQLPVGQATQYGWQILPGPSGMDGFYYARLQKQV